MSRAAGSGALGGPVTVDASDGTMLHGLLCEPEDANGLALLLTHGVASDHRGGLGRWLGPAVGARGYATLSLDRRDRGPGPITATFEDGLDDLRAGVDVLEARGFEHVVLCGHSKGTAFLADYAVSMGDPRIAGLAMFAVVHDNHVVARDLIFGELFDESLAAAERATSEGRVEPLTFSSGGGSGVEMSGPAFVSFFGPHTRAAPMRTIGDVDVPVLLCRAVGDSLTPGSFQDAVTRAARAAGVAVTELTVGTPDAADPPDPLEAHRFVGVEEATAGQMVVWLERVVNPLVGPSTTRGGRSHGEP